VEVRGGVTGWCQTGTVLKDGRFLEDIVNTGAPTLEGEGERVKECREVMAGVKKRSLGK